MSQKSQALVFLLSPAKTMKFSLSRHAKTLNVTQPAFPQETNLVVESIKSLSKSRLKSLLGVSDSLTTLNYDRYQSFETKKDAFVEPVEDVAIQSILAYHGAAYAGLDAESLNKAQLDYVAQHLRILSGVYGLACPTDIIQPYRLDMGTKLAVGDAQNLYEHWKDIITPKLIELVKSNNAAVINVASQEYFKALDLKQVNDEGGRVITCEFREGPARKIISFNAKRARGLMVRYAALTGATTPEQLQAFNLENWGFDAQHSSSNTFVFYRSQAPAKKSAAKKSSKKVSKKGISDDVGELESSGPKKKRKTN